MIRKLMLASMVLGLVAVPLQQADAAAAKKKGPVTVEANQMELVEGGKQAIFTGSVDAVREDGHIKSDKMVVDYADTKQPDGTMKSEVSSLDSTGNVTITTKTQVITGDWAKMNVDANTLVVGGNVKVVQGKTVLMGPKLDVDLDTNRTVMSGGRVKGSFVPN
jgi:lipopolysaccharide export system protein LptA